MSQGVDPLDLMAKLRNQDLDAIAANAILLMSFHF